MDGVYSAEVAERYLMRQVGEEVPPHVFGIASAAYGNLKNEQTDQAIIISGESGAGKTEATKKCLQFLAEAASRVAGSSETQEDAASGGSIEKKLLNANPVLEAFGNAKTVRNNNSSRFGKWMVVHFNMRSQICASEIINYLLEKSRVVLQANEERNYHVFYQLSQIPWMQQEFDLQSPEHFHYTNQSGCIQVPRMNDKEEMEDVMQAMWAVAGMTPPPGVLATERPPEQFMGMLRLAAAILHIGNVQFDPVPGKEDEACTVSSSVRSERAIANAARILGVDGSALRGALSQKVIQSGTERITTQLSVERAADARNSLARALYGRAFDWLVK